MGSCTQKHCYTIPWKTYLTHEIFKLFWSIRVKVALHSRNLSGASIPWCSAFVFGRMHTCRSCYRPLEMWKKVWVSKKIKWELNHCAPHNAKRKLMLGLNHWIVYMVSNVSANLSQQYAMHFPNSLSCINVICTPIMSCCTPAIILFYLFRLGPSCHGSENGHERVLKDNTSNSIFICENQIIY